MITEKGKEYIARNFGVNNCFALEEVVPCTVYTEGAPNERVLDTSTILFLLATEVADWVSTAAGKFTLGDLIAANDGSYISMMDALEIEAYCIAGAPPITPPVTPPGPPTVSVKDFEIVNPIVNCDSNKCYAQFDLKNNGSSASAYVRVEIDGAPCYKRHVYILRGAKKAQVVTTSIAGLSSGYHNLTIAVGKDVDTDTYTHRFLVGEPGIEPPAPAAKMTKAEIIEELRRRDAIDTAAVSTAVSANKWYMFKGRLNWHTANFEMGIEIRNLQTRNPPTQVSDISLTEEKMTPLAGLDRNWVLARLGELSYTAPPTIPTGVPGVTIAVDKTTCRINEQIRLTGTYTSEDGRLLVGHDIGFYGYLKGTKKYLGKTKTTSGGQYSFTFTPTKDGTWQFTAYNDYTSPKVTVTVTVRPPVTPPYTPPVTPTEPPEAIKAWIVANYGDGTRVTSGGWLKLFDANMANNLAPLPAGYTKASITEGVVQWAKANPNWEIQTICGWINSIGVTNLTEDHGRYIHSLAIGWTTIANDFYNKLSPKPPIPPTAIVTEDNGRGVYGYAIGWNTLANEFTGCDF